ncbi:legumin B isoform X1 [Ostrinia furnacalis]|uniref:legumin B isoform X1 n=1 Tax=Ostrinia furnacalis TaxID=93504 RepID=UPI00103EEE13|nr:legumin B isoform X1 [Ostrinia furnacalis]
MSQRLMDTTKLVWYFLILYTGPYWSPSRCAAIKVPPKTPSTIEAQAKFFQDFFSVQLSPYKIEFGHVCEDPNTWEQRYEKKDYKNHRDMGKVRWGDKKGGYGEHYWDLNHAGHGNDHGDDGNDHSDDGSYHHDDHSDHGYDGSHENSPSYGDEYDPEKSSYEESGRAKRAHPKIKVERHSHRDNNENPKPKSRKNNEQLQEEPSHKVENVNYSDEDDQPEEEVYKKPKRSHHRHTYDEDEERPQQKETKNQVVLVVKEKDGNNQDNTHQKYQDFSQFVPYEGGAGVRQHHHPETVAAASVPRLFWEPTTGHVVDRATGQAYVLQPIAAPANYN